MRTEVDYTGQRFGKLTAVERTELKDGRGFYLWKFVCDCGEVSYQRIRAYIDVLGACYSCRKHKKSGQRHVSNTRHGLTRSAEYKCLAGAIARCYDKNSTLYERYGAKGLKVEQIFLTNFMAFLEHVGPQPKDGQTYTLDRIDNSKGYVRGNIRWATKAQQARNRGICSNNTSGYTGVGFKRNSGGDITHVKASWVTLDGKPKAKEFSVAKYGLFDAFILAYNHRKEMIIQLNEQGAGYTENHGK
jgi:hypothetical protein